MVRHLQQGGDRLLHGSDDWLWLRCRGKNYGCCHWNKLGRYDKSHLVRPNVSYARHNKQCFQAHLIIVRPIHRLIHPMYVRSGQFGNLQRFDLSLFLILPQGIVPDIFPSLQARGRYHFTYNPRRFPRSIAVGPGSDCPFVGIDLPRIMRVAPVISDSAVCPVNPFHTFSVRTVHPVAVAIRVRGVG